MSAPGELRGGQDGPPRTWPTARAGAGHLAPFSQCTKLGALPRIAEEPTGPLLEHVDDLLTALRGFRRSAARIAAWGQRLAAVLSSGGRLLAAGNGGSAAEAQHLTAELVGRYLSERPPFSAIALHAETSSLTAIGNDYGADAIFARQVHAHGRPGDVLMLLSTSGRSRNLTEAAKAGHASGVITWGLTGRAPNPLAVLCDEAIAVDADQAATVQEVQLVAIHQLCTAVDAALGIRTGCVLLRDGATR
jgi:D-sedoheptulose 7-phosphate isomerase